MFSIEDTDDDKVRQGDPFRQRFEAFQALLAANNGALETMADMEEKLSGDYLFDRHYLESSADEVLRQVKTIVECMNLIGHDRYRSLYDAHARITERLEQVLSRHHAEPGGDLVIPLSEVRAALSGHVGVKCANLGEVKNATGLAVPDGFGISAFAFSSFMERSGLLDAISHRLSSLPENDLDALETAGSDIQSLIGTAAVPPDLEEPIRKAYRELCVRAGGEIPVSVRSSALHEDGEFSFAGQYSSILNVWGEDAVIEAYRLVVASLFNTRALFYLKTKGFGSADMVMPVCVLAMIDARAGGVTYSLDPNNVGLDAVLTTAVRGLGKAVVDGSVHASVYAAAREGSHQIIERREGQQHTRLACLEKGGIAEQPVNESELVAACLSNEEVAALADAALMLERHFGGPQDIEWVIDKSGSLFILQSRPLRVISSSMARPVPPEVPGYDLLITKGVIACRGIGFGQVHTVLLDKDLRDFPEGGVLVARHTSPKFVTVMPKAAAIVTDVGTATGHMASLAREFRVPTILDTECATSVLKNGDMVTVDAVNGNVYAGHVRELEEFAGRESNPFKETSLFRTFERVLELIAPLSLVDPDAENFMAESCSTLHDITRFCHEMAMRELFNIEHISADDVGAIRLVASIPTEIWLLDLGGAIEGSPKHLNPEHLRSEPFNALFRGLTSMKWPEAKAFDVQGFLGAVAHTATVSEDELRRSAEKSFAFLTDRYMSFAIRLGYHLSTIEAFAGDNLNDNYIRFFFKGGGAIIDRRLRRVRLISEVLRRMDFNVRQTDDVIEASLAKYRKQTILEKLEVLGRFTVFTKQLDMVMYNDIITDAYIEEFCSTHLVPKPATAEA